MSGVKKYRLFPDRITKNRIRNSECVLNAGMGESSTNILPKSALIFFLPFEIPCLTPISFPFWVSACGKLPQQSKWSEKNRDYVFFPVRAEGNGATGVDVFLRAQTTPRLAWIATRYSAVWPFFGITSERPSCFAVISAKASFKSAVFIYTGNNVKLVLFLLRHRDSRVNFAQENQLAAKLRSSEAITDRAPLSAIKELAKSIGSVFSFRVQRAAICPSLVEPLPLPSPPTSSPAETFRPRAQLF